MIRIKLFSSIIQVFHISRLCQAFWIAFVYEMCCILCNNVWKRKYWREEPVTGSYNTRTCDSTTKGFVSAEERDGVRDMQLTVVEYETCMKRHKCA